MLVVERERFLERPAQPLEEVERSAQKEHFPLDAPPLGKAGNRLIDDCLEDGGGDIRLARALIEKGLDIRFCKHAAARGNGIHALRLQRKGVHLLYRDIEQRCHLVDERARSARAAAVHALLRPPGDEDDLGVLAAQFHRNIRIGIQPADGAVRRLHLLHEGDLAALRDAQPRRARDAGMEGGAKGAYLFQLGEHALAHPRIMAHIGRIQDGACFVENAYFYRRGSDVYPKISRHSVSLLLHYYNTIVRT